MALYKITRTDVAGFDEYDEIIVRASSEGEALSLVCRVDSAYLKATGRGWTLYSGFRIDGSNAEAVLIPETGTAEVISASFCAG